jgi:hypothetical protein
LQVQVLVLQGTSHMAPSIISMQTVPMDLGLQTQFLAGYKFNVLNLLKIWKVGLKCRAIASTENVEGHSTTVQITEWSISASIDGTNFTTLLNSSETLSGSALALLFFIVPSTASAYPNYRVSITEAVLSERVVGLQIMQL